MSFYSSQSDYQTVQGDKQTIDEQLGLPDGTHPDLTGRSVEFVMRHMPSAAKVVSAAATIDDATAGSVSYTLAPGETGRAGLHHAEWILTGGDEDPTTLPVDRPVSIFVREDVEGDGPVAETLPDDIDGQTITPAQVGTPDNPFVGHAGELSGTHIPDQGDVQAALDAAAADGGGAVMLRPNVDYDPAAPWDVGHDVTLDCNGATIVPTTDTDIINVHPQATVLNPRIDVSGITHTSNVFTFDTAFQGDYFRDGPTVVDGGWTLGGFDGTTVSYLYQNNGGTLSNVHVHHHTVDCACSAELYSPEPTGFINANRFSGYWSDNQTDILLHGDDTNANLFDVILEPGGLSDVGWDLQTGRHNKITGFLYDPQSYDTTPWRIGANADGHNAFYSIGSGRGIQSRILDNANNPTNNLITTTKRTPVAQSASDLPDSAAVGTEMYVQDDDRYYYWRD